MRAAIEAEYLKLRRSRTVAVASAVLVVGIPALVAGFLRATVSSPQSQLSAKVRAMVSGTGWAAYLGLADQVAAVAVLLGVGIVVAWCFGRAFADHTLVSVYALPISRGTIAAAKAVVVGAWAAGVSLLVTLVLLLAGPLAGVGLPDGEAARGAPRTLAVIVLTAVLALTLALPASLGRGYLPAMGALLLVVLLTQILVTLGTGAWLPYAAPALWSQTSVPVDVTPVQLALVPVFAGAVLWVTLRRWQRMKLSGPSSAGSFVPDRRRQGDAGDEQPARRRPPSRHRAHLAAGDTWPGHHQGGDEARVDGVEADRGVLEPEPASGERVPGLVDALLGAEEQAVPGDVRTRGTESGQLCDLPGHGDVVQDPGRQRPVGLRVHAQGHHGVATRCRCRPVTFAVGHRAHEPGRPRRRPVVPWNKGGTRHAELGEGGPGAGTDGSELVAPLRHRSADDGLLLGEQRLVHRLVERLGHRGTGDDVRDHVHASTTRTTARTVTPPRSDPSAVDVIQRATCLAPHVWTSRPAERATLTRRRVEVPRPGCRPLKLEAATARAAGGAGWCRSPGAARDAPEMALDLRFCAAAALAGPQTVVGRSSHRHEEDASPEVVTFDAVFRLTPRHRKLRLRQDGAVSDLAQCPGCGLQLAAADRSADHRVNASPACLALYDEVVGFAYQHGQLMRLHQLTVDAYGAQHGGGGTPPIRLAYSLVGLHLALDHGLSGESVRTAHMRMGKPDPTWPRFTPPEDVGPVTVLTVADRGARLDSPAGHAAAVDTWAHQTWLAWSDQHAEVAELTRRLLADLVTG